MVLTAGARLLAVRMAWIGLASLPAALALRGDLALGPGAEPWFTDVSGRLPLFHVLRLFGALPAIAPTLLVAVVLAVLGNQMLTAGALAIFLGRARAGVLRSVRREGMRHLGPFLRILAIGIAAAIVGAAIVGAAIDEIEDVGMRRGWTAATIFLLLPALRTTLVAVWLAKVGALLLAARALTVADGRRTARRTVVLALRLCWRAKTGWFLSFVVATLATTIGSGAILGTWFHAEPSGANLLGWLGLWVGVVAVQAAIWLWLVHGAALLVDGPRAHDLRSVPDVGFRWIPRWRLRRAADRRAGRLVQYADHERG